MKRITRISSRIFKKYILTVRTNSTLLTLVTLLIIILKKKLEICNTYLKKKNCRNQKKHFGLNFFTS